MEFSFNGMPEIRPIRYDVTKTRLGAVVEWLRFKRKWELSEDWYFTINGTEFVIEKGFVFDGASVPRCCWAFLSPTGTLFIPSIIHDFMYKHKHLMLSDGFKQECSRQEADKLFRRLSIEGTKLVTVNYVIYLILRIVGWYAWNKY